MHTNNTSHYNLPQFIGSDIPNPLTDWNDSMQDIDTAMYEIKTQADEIGANVVQDETDISDLQSQANLTDDNITLLNQQTTAARTAATDAQDAANRNASNIATLQQSVTNNRTSITQYNNRFNQNVPFAFGIEKVEDPDNPGTMIEKYGYYTTDDPAEFIAFGESARIIKLATQKMVVSGVSQDSPLTQTLTWNDIPNNVDIDDIIINLEPTNFETGLGYKRSSTFAFNKQLNNNTLTISLTIPAKDTAFVIFCATITPYIFTGRIVENS